MRILYIDIDTLRPDHLGCYGYGRNTSPNIDRLASEGIRFDNCHASDTPCLPSRSALMLGRFGIHTGVVNHGGSTADPRINPEKRIMCQHKDYHHLPKVLRDQGKYRTVSISSFAERHAAYWFHQGFYENYDVGKGGAETAEEVLNIAERWLNENAAEDHWFTHVHLWDPHTPYRTPESVGRPFDDVPLAADWHTDEVLEAHRKSYGPQTATSKGRKGLGGQVFEGIQNAEDYKNWVDGYDTGILYADAAVGRIIDILEEKGILDETVVIVSSDHGESMGELNVYGEPCMRSLACRGHDIQRTPLYFCHRS